MISHNPGTQNTEYRIQNGRRSLFFCLLFSVSCFLVSATPFYYQGYNSDGTANTNTVTMIAWPPSTNTWTAVGTNIVYGGKTISLVPDTNGYVTNWAYPNTYFCILSNLNSGFFVSIPNTTNTLSLADCITNAPVITGTYLDGYGLVTNWLSFAPATNTSAGLIAALGYTPTTNSWAGVTNSLGFAPATNTSAGLIAALGYTPTTNSFAGITNALNYQPSTNSFAGITNALNYQPSTNSFAGITNALNYQPSTNSWAGVTNALGYQPVTNSWAGVTNALGYTAATNIATALTTNISVLIAGSETNTLYFTNGILGAVTNP